MPVLNKQNSLRLLQHLREDQVNPLASSSLSKGRQALITLQERTMTPYQELIERVRKIDKEAAEYLEGKDVKKLPNFEPREEVSLCFYFKDTPQGKQYWYCIAEQLGEY